MAYRSAKPSKVRTLYVPSQTKPFAISRAKIELFVECPNCFYLDRVEGIARPSMPAFLLNSAVDVLLKKEFDAYRLAGEAHPLMIRAGIDAVPFAHADLEAWRNPFSELRHLDAKTGFEIFGAPDDLWQRPDGTLHVVDYKSTSKDGEVSLDDRWKAGYKRQVEIYRWLLERNGFAVSPTAYFVYANGSRAADAFDGRLEFDVAILPYEGTVDWVDDILGEMRDVLDGRIPAVAGADCEYCAYAKRRWEREGEFEDVIEL